ncbi:hypothetical protein [Blastococcus sp. TF02A-30]|uniref:hypothetical protein n=1 Tax=Blastococcus sp. TF02A-30 TaxID=2250580 RepID=UPI000DEB9274|nr:hypothetical protein [Blastococcus sp. TF02A-30]RBY91059.1 hypothetical protein DQ241_05135 [Blastococcus sp. TF02A-30]
MARSINEWFGDHADSSLGDFQDDEVVERPAPWDVAGSGMTTTRSGRKALGFGSNRASRGRSAVGRSGDGRSSAAATSAKKRQQATTAQPRKGATKVETQIRRTAAAHPGTGYKQLARMLRAVGLNVTRADVARVLAHPNSAWKRKASSPPPPRKPAMVIRIPADAQRSRVVPATDLCPSCGMRPTVLGTCRCS